MKKDDFTVGGADVDDNKDYTDENVKVDAKAKTGKLVELEDMKKTKGSIMISGKPGSSLVSRQASSSGVNLFTHHRKRQKEGPSALILDYENIREAILELYLSVKIRPDEEIDNYNNAQYEREKYQLRNVNGYDLIDQIKSCIEALMSMKIDGSTMDNFDLAHDIDIELPAGVKSGLKDVSDQMLATDKMDEHLKKSLALAKGQLKRDRGGDDL
jgi:hypothetical protein